MKLEIDNFDIENIKTIKDENIDVDGKLYKVTGYSLKNFNSITLNIEPCQTETK
jgi:hypothetical protein